MGLDALGLRRLYPCGNPMSAPASHYEPPASLASTLGVDLVAQYQDTSKRVLDI